MLSVPYAGYGGDYESIAILTSGGATPPFRKLAQRVGWVAATDFTPTYTFPAGPITYTMAQTMQFGRRFRDIPTAGVHLDHQARWVRITVLDAAGDPWSRRLQSQTLDPVAVQVDLHPRNSTAGGFFAFGWDGRLVSHLVKRRDDSRKTCRTATTSCGVEVLKPLGTAQRMSRHTRLQPHHRSPVVVSR